MISVTIISLSDLSIRRLNNDEYLLRFKNVAHITARTVSVFLHVNKVFHLAFDLNSIKVGPVASYKERESK